MDEDKVVEISDDEKILKTLQNVADNVLIIKEDVGVLKREVPGFVKKPELYGAISDHANSLTAHGRIGGFTKRQMLKILCFVATLSVITGVAMAYILR